MAKMLKRLAWYLFLAAGVTVLFDVPFHISRMLFTIPLPAVVSLGLILSVATVWIAMSLPIQSLRQMETSTQDQLHLWFLAVLILGVVLRVVWVYTVPPVQLSDTRANWELAQHLLETGIYSFETGIFSEELLRAYRPPGYSFFLAACMAIVGQKLLIPTFTNMGFYLLTSVAVRSITRQLADDKAALVAVRLLALWPSYLAMTGLALTEPLSSLLFVAILWAVMMARQHGGGCAVIAGVRTGFGALVCAPLLVLPAVWVLYIAMHREGHWLTLQHTAVAVLFVALTIAPWTIRNYRLLGAFIPISTNGGANFYRANNPLASGGYTRQGRTRLGCVPE